MQDFFPNGYEETWTWMEDAIDVPDILAEYLDEYSTNFDLFLMEIIWDLWDKYPHRGKLSLDAVADYVNLFL